MKIKIVRKIDKLGRIVILKDVRKTLNIQPEDDIEIAIENDTFVLKKVEKTL